MSKKRNVNAYMRGGEYYVEKKPQDQKAHDCRVGV